MKVDDLLRGRNALTHAKWNQYTMRRRVVTFNPVRLPEGENSDFLAGFKAHADLYGVVIHD